MNNAGKSMSAAFKLNTARSLKYKILSTSLFMCAAPVYLMSNKHDAQECRLHPPMQKQKRKIYVKESTLISTGGVFMLVCYLNWESKQKSFGSF